jgi:outer membrane lipoprotein carrier protein
LGLGSLPGWGASDTDIHRIADRVDAHYNRLQTLQADFSETYNGAGVNRTESGVLWLKRPGQMRWEYRQPREKLFLSDGKTVWFYVPGERQVRRMPLHKLDDLHSPLAYLLGHTRLEKEFTGLSLATNLPPDRAGDLVLRGVPRRLGGVEQVLFEIAPDGSFDRIVVAQEDGSTTEFRFSNQVENHAISAARFQFTVPPGVETVQADQLEQ